MYISHKWENKTKQPTKQQKHTLVLMGISELTSKHEAGKCFIYSTLRYQWTVTGGVPVFTDRCVSGELTL